MENHMKTLYSLKNYKDEGVCKSKSNKIKRVKIIELVY